VQFSLCRRRGINGIVHADRRLPHASPSQVICLLLVVDILQEVGQCRVINNEPSTDPLILSR